MKIQKRKYAMQKPVTMLSTALSIGVPNISEARVSATPNQKASAFQMTKPIMGCCGSSLTVPFSSFAKPSRLTVAGKLADLGVRALCPEVLAEPADLWSHVGEQAACPGARALAGAPPPCRAAPAARCLLIPPCFAARSDYYYYVIYDLVDEARRLGVCHAAHRLTARSAGHRVPWWGGSAFGLALSRRPPGRADTLPAPRTSQWPMAYSVSFDFRRLRFWARRLYGGFGGARDACSSLWKAS
eukprot:3332157-Prymnesium_polylepis.3